MKLRCMYCHKRMEPTIKVEKRIVNEDQQTYYCSLCGKELITLGSILEKPFWQQPLGLWMLPIVSDAIAAWEVCKRFKIKKGIAITIVVLIIVASVVSFLYFL